MADWRFHLITVPGGEWVDRDLQLQKASITEALNGAGDISGSLPLGYRMINTPSGKRGLVEWGSAIVAEQEGRDPVFGIVDDISTEGDELSVSAGGFTAYPQGMPWVDNQFSSTKVDALDVVRLIWEKLQNKPNGNLGVTVDSVKSGYFLGKPEGAKLTAAKNVLASRKEKLDYWNEILQLLANDLQSCMDRAMVAAGLPKGGMWYRQTSAPTGDKRSKRNIWLKGNVDGLTAAHTWNGKKWVEMSASKFNTVSDLYFDWEDLKKTQTADKASQKAAKEAYNDAKSKVDELRDEEAQPYTLNWWDSLDLGGVIKDLAEETPFEFREETKWNGDDALSHRLRVGTPNLGVRREDLVLEIGVNVTAPPPLTETDFVSDVVVLGSGEGRSMVRATAKNNVPSRLRRVAVVERKSITRAKSAEVAARRDLDSRVVEWSFDSLDIVDHPNCPYGRFDTGDWLYLTGDAGWANIEQWVRVLEITINCTDGSINLKVSTE